MTCCFGCEGDELVVTDERGLTLPTHLCREAEPSAPCRSADDIEALLQDDSLEIVAASATSTGVQRARVLTLKREGERPVVLRAKWRADSTTTRRNNPRYELAAYAVQKLFLSPREYVVPPTAAHCFPLDQYRAHVDRAAQPSPGKRCVNGVLSYWLEDVTSVADANTAGWFHGQHGHVFDPKLWERDAAYRDSLARVNLLTYLIGHRDSHARNFVIARDGGKPARHVVYSIDNSLAFTLAKNPNLPARSDWSVLRVPAVPRDAVDRLRASYERLSSLATVLAPWELEGVRARAAALLSRVERGELRLY